MVKFGNAGEVDNLIEGAKRRCLERINNNNNTGIPRGSGPLFTFTGGVMKLDKADIDPDFDRLIKAGSDIDALFDGVIGCDEIKKKIKTYPKLAATAKEKGANVGSVPTTFIFKDPPGNDADIFLVLLTFWLQP